MRMQELAQALGESGMPPDVLHCVMRNPLRDGYLADARKFSERLLQAVARQHIGPGAEVTPETCAVVRTCLENLIPTVLDGEVDPLATEDLESRLRLLEELSRQ